MRERMPDYPPEYDDDTECVSCGDDAMNAPQPIPDEAAIESCCSWECLSVLYKVQRDELRDANAKLRREACGKWGRHEMGR